MFLLFEALGPGPLGAGPGNGIFLIETHPGLCDHFPCHMDLFAFVRGIVLGPLVVLDFGAKFLLKLAQIHSKLFQETFTC